MEDARYNANLNMNAVDIESALNGLLIWEPGIIFELIVFFLLGSVGAFVRQAASNPRQGQAPCIMFCKHLEMTSIPVPNFIDKTEDVLGSNRQTICSGTF